MNASVVVELLTTRFVKKEEMDASTFEKRDVAVAFPSEEMFTERLVVVALVAERSTVVAVMAEDDVAKRLVLVALVDVIEKKLPIVERSVAMKPVVDVLLVLASALVEICVAKRDEVVAFTKDASVADRFVVVLFADTILVAASAVLVDCEKVAWFAESVLVVTLLVEAVPAVRVLAKRLVDVLLVEIVLLAFSDAAVTF